MVVSDLRPVPDHRRPSDMGSLAATLFFILYSITTTCQGQYDSLERAALKSIPEDVAAIRDSLIDSSLYKEIMFQMLTYALPTDSENPICANHSIDYQLAFLQDEVWALKMMDASSKVEAGVMVGNFQGLGHYDECLSVEGPSGNFQGQLCIVVTKDLLRDVRPGYEQSSQYMNIPALPTRFAFSTCVPSSCSASDVQAHWQGVLGDFNASAFVNPRDCSVRGDLQPSNTTWVALSVFAVLFLAVFFSTCYDYSVGHQPTKERKILLCFSAYTNHRKLFQTERRSDNLNMLDGLRVLAICWIVLGHRFEMSLQFPNVSMINFEKYCSAWFMSPILNMMLGVEIFFLISGCLLTYHFLNARAQSEPFSIVHYYYKRYMRLTPPFAAVMLLEGCLLLYMSEGPLWKRFVGFRADSCANYWWSSFLYISNYINPYRICLVQSWYLSADMQLYMLAPLLLLPLAYYHRGLHVLAACYVGTTAAAFLNALYSELPAGSTVTLDNKTERNHGYEYVKTHVRAASWLTGVALGYILHTQCSLNQTWKIPKVMAGVGWFISMFLCVTAIYSISPFQSLKYHYSHLVDSLHIALHRNVFSLGVAGVILLCSGGRGGWVKDLLGWKGFRPLATLSYGVYLCHMGLQTVGFARLRQPYSLDMYSMFLGYLSDLLLANLVAILLYVSVEAPAWEISRWIYSPGKKQENKKRNLQKAFENPQLENNINIEEEKSAL